IHADEVSATWDGAAVVATGGDVTIDGPITPPNESAEENPVPSVVGGPTSVHVQSAHISWTHCAGDASLDIKNVSGDFSLAPHIGDSFTWQGDTSVVWNNSTVGPLATQVTRDAKGDHARLSLDPANPAAETLGIDRDATSARYEWIIQKRAVSKIGVPPAMLGFAPAGDPLVSLHVVDSVSRPTSGAPTASGLLSLSSDAVTLPQVPDPVSASVDISWQGDPDSTMPVSGGKFTAGPFVGTITGTISRPAFGAAVDLAFSSNTVPCSKFASADPATMLGGPSFGALAAMAGVKSAVVGDVKIAGNVRFDSRNPAIHEVSFAPSTTCGVSISLGSGSK
ncbi:MAG: hypothetical protein ABI461_14725, partial [Polyangiaceae bacterium]